MFLLEPELFKGKCPICKEINDIILTFSDLIDELRSFLLLTNCYQCGQKLLIKKDSEFIICSNCKSTIVIDKDSCQELGDSIYLSPEELYLLLKNENSFNPYLIPENLYNFIKENYEKLLRQKKETKFDQRNPLLHSGDEHLFHVVKQNQMNITQKYINKKI